ncbi:hypothetical protein M011DRAFT_386479, partial [Sporormia fimetaria CBS 119925]
THPRRRPLKANVPSLPAHGMQLRKSGTFSSPKPASSDICDLDNALYMPRRSPTSTEDLEDLLNDAGVQRVANLLKDLDKKLAGHTASPASILKDPEVLPLPSFLLSHNSMNESRMDVDPKRPTDESNPHDHASDSGLGSSISSKSKFGKAHSRLHPTGTPLSDQYKGGTAAGSHSAVTRSYSAVGSFEDKHTLGEYASKQIHDSIIKPILAEESLKEFHPLINDVPRRIGSKNICNLRDLEKTLLFLAPEFSATPTSYLRFCELSIHCLRSTVNSLSDRDQRLPTDRPYTNNYFLDLMEQIRRYAAIMAATRQKSFKGHSLDEMDCSTYAPSNATLHVTNLIRHSDLDVRPMAVVREKRALPDGEVDDEDVYRSMARRRKSEKPGDVLHGCRNCDKVFKRPCDLTKHEKTHSRPWKCTDGKCKYFELGWPTEKERDRHVNDKHSNAPPQFKCQFSPCTYASKRESNCKQHMEKAHGWNYVRSKNNGRKKPMTTASSSRSPVTPLTPFIDTPSSASVSASTTPATPFMISPAAPLLRDFDFTNGFGTPAMSTHDLQDQYRRDSLATNESSMLTYSSNASPLEPTSFENAMTPEDTHINHGDIFSCGMNTTNFAAPIQQPTPAWNTDYMQFNENTYSFNNAMMGTPAFTDMSNPGPSTAMPHLSPLGQANVTLMPSSMDMDEGFSDDFTGFAAPTGDFTLFDSGPSTLANNSNANFFPELTQFGGQFDNSNAFP